MNKIKHILISICLLGGTLSVAAEAKPALPNIVFIFIDDMGYADIGPFGNTTLRTPQLDQMAKEGRRFTTFYATTVCTMSDAQP